MDYALRLQGQNKVFVEVKRGAEDLGKHQEQLLSYSFQQGVRLAVLTNGLIWWFYLPLQEASWEQRKFDSVEIEKHDVEQASEKFLNYLLRDDVGSGRAVQAANKVYQDIQRNALIESTLPKAWDKVLSERNDSFVDLINRTVEEICGFRASREVIMQFVREKGRFGPTAATVSQPHFRTEDLVRARRQPRPAKDEIITRSEWRRILLQTLVEMGGSAKESEITERIESKIKDRLSAVDLERLGSGEVRWKKNLYWEKHDCKKQGLLEGEARHGIWEISEKGRNYLGSNT